MNHLHMIQLRYIYADMQYEAFMDIVFQYLTNHEQEDEDYEEDDKLFGFTDDWETYWDSVYQ